MNKLFANKKNRILIFVLIILVLVGIILGVALGGNSDNNEDIIVYETDENTIEEKAEEGLEASDSEDGPVLDEDSMIDFNGTGPTSNNANSGDNNVSDSNAQTGNTDTGNVDEPKNENQNDDKKNDSKDTGSWGTFY